MTLLRSAPTMPWEQVRWRVIVCRASVRSHCTLLEPRHRHNLHVPLVCHCLSADTNAERHFCYTTFIVLISSERVRVIQICQSDHLTNVSACFRTLFSAVYETSSQQNPLVLPLVHSLTLCTSQEQLWRKLLCLNALIGGDKGAFILKSS